MRINYWAKLEPEICYHVYNKTVGDSKLFFKDENYHFFLKRWKEYLDEYLTIYAYCLIPNHFHFLIKCKSPNDKILQYIKQENTVKANKYLLGEIPYHVFLESQFKRFFTSYVLAVNKQQKRTGTLLQNRFKRIVVKDKEHFRFMLLYIHHNVIHHRLGNDFHD